MSDKKPKCPVCGEALTQTDVKQEETYEIFG